MQIIMGYIYKITNTVNDKVYIGQTTRTLTERYEEHLRCACKRVNRYLYDAMNHYGYDKFKIEPITEVGNEQLNDLERFYIAKFKSADPTFGYNITNGGDGFDGKLPEEIEKRRAANVSKALKGRPQPEALIEKRVAKLKGQKRTIEQRQHFSEAQKKRDPSTFARGFIVPQERRDRISRTLLGKKQSEETKLKRKESISKLKWWNNGIENIRTTECPEGFVAGRINFKPSDESKAKSSHKGTKWFTNGIENRMTYECPEGFWPGKTFKKDLIK